MFEQTFKNIDDILYKDSGADSELDYIGQTSWVLFLRYLDDLEHDKADHAELQGKEYKFIIDEEYRWPVWAMPKTPDGKLDHHKALTGPDLVQFVDLKLFPYLADFKKRTDNPQTIEYKIGEIFSELKNKIQSGYNLREIIELVDELPFRSNKDKHELSHLYETKIKNMGNAGRNGGQYYTPRPLIRAMIEVTAPKIGERIYDGAVGSAGFLCETYEYLTRDREKLSTSDLKALQESTFYGKEKKNLAYVIGVMNMILHGIEAPNIIHTNTLSENIRDIQEKDRYHVILANPPFGGKERPEVQQNFDIKTGETAYLFLQHFIKSLKAGGRAAIVIKNTLLSNADNASISLRKLLLESCNLHTILDMPGGTFLGAGVKTVVLFFTKGEPTQIIWYYQLEPGRNMGKTNPLNDADMAEFIALQKTKPESEKSWKINVEDVRTNDYDLSVKNPNKPEEEGLRTPQQILEEIHSLDLDTNDIIQSIKDLFQNNVNNIFNDKGKGWMEKRFDQVCVLQRGFDLPTHSRVAGIHPLVSSNGITDRINEYKVKGPGVVTGRSGTIGNVHFIEEDFWPLNTALYIKEFHGNDERFIFYFLKQFDLSKYMSGAGVPTLNRNDVHRIRVSIPADKDEQRNIAQKLDALSEVTKKLEEKYQQKLAALDDLKKSILEQAFKGELKEKEISV